MVVPAVHGLRGPRLILHDEVCLHHWNSELGHHCSRPPAGEIETIISEQSIAYEEAKAKAKAKQIISD